MISIIRIFQEKHFITINARYVNKYVNNMLIDMLINMLIKIDLCLHLEYLKINFINCL